MSTTKGVAWGFFSILIMGCLALAGCDENQAHNQAQAKGDLEVWKALCAKETARNEELQSVIESERLANAEWSRKCQSAQEQIDQFKAQGAAEKAIAIQEIAGLKTELDLAKRASAAVAPSVAAKGSTVPPESAPAQAAEHSKSLNLIIAEAEKEVADLQARLTELQGRAGLARTKVSNLQQATVDVRLVPPDGHGDEWFRSHPSMRRGDFRSEMEKQEAVRMAKEVLVPIEIELRKTQDDLAKAKLNLAKTRAVQGTK
jgi:hypothetical protein